MVHYFLLEPRANQEHLQQPMLHRAVGVLLSPCGRQAAPPPPVYRRPREGGQRHRVLRWFPASVSTLFCSVCYTLLLLRLSPWKTMS
ncbi:unnamed protein product [Boreogadus saida]